MATGPLSYPWWLRITHWFNFFFIVLLFRSGYEILVSHPKLYWTDDAGPEPLFTIRFGRLSKTAMPRSVYRVTSPCFRAEPNPIVLGRRARRAGTR